MTRDPGQALATLSATSRSVLERALAPCGRLGIDLFLVGGAVRDLMLGEEVRDLDLVWEGAAAPDAVVEAFAGVFGAPASNHPEFLTASFTGPGGLRIDLGRARAESYRAPAALPTVRPSGLRQDLLRRDFTVNAMAIDLARPSALADPGGGAADLDRRLLRTLHPLSFRDDPTRILRGCELAVRRDFELEQETRAQAITAVEQGFPARLSGARVAHELARLLGAAGRSAAGAERVRRLGMDRALHEAFRIEEEGLRRLERLEMRYAGDEGPRGPAAPSFWILALTLLSWHRPAAARRSVAAWLGLARDERAWLESGPERLSSLLQPGPAIESSPEVAAERYSRLSEAEIRVVEMLMEPERMQDLRRVEELSRIELEVGGDDLLAAGAAAGPRIGAALEATLAARRRGEIGPRGELDFALAWLARESTTE